MKMAHRLPQMIIITEKLALTGYMHVLTHVLRNRSLGLGSDQLFQNTTMK